VKISNSCPQGFFNRHETSFLEFSSPSEIGMQENPRDSEWSLWIYIAMKKLVKVFEFILSRILQTVSP